MRKTTENLNDDSETPDLDLNQGPSEYERMPLTGRRGFLQKNFNFRSIIREVI
jgi:hypothetical protein